MVLCQKRKVNAKNRIQIPTEIAEGMGIREGDSVYISFDEKTKEIKITLGDIERKER